MDQDPVSGGFRFGRSARSSSDSAVVRVYKDLNGDGKFRQGDEILSVDSVLAEPRGRSQTMADGAVLLESLPRDALSGVAVETNSLSDPFVIPANSGTSFLTRAGVVSEINLAVIDSAEAEFYLADENGEPAENQIATITSCDGVRKIKERSAYDGMVFFQYIEPGCYVFSAKHQGDIQFEVKGGEIFRLE